MKRISIQVIAIVMLSTAMFANEAEMKNESSSNIVRGENENLKIYTVGAFIDKVTKLASKDDFETKDQYLLRIQKNIGGKKVFVKYSAKDVAWVKYDIEQQKFNTNFSLFMLEDFPKYKLLFSNTFDLQKKMRSFPGRNGDEAAVNMPFDIAMAKTVKNIPNYGFDIYAVVSIDETFQNTFHISRFKDQPVSVMSVNVENIIIENKKLNFYKELM